MLHRRGLLLFAMLGTVGSAEDCDDEDTCLPAGSQAHRRLDVAAFFTQFVPQSAHSKKTRAGRRKANLAARQPTCGTLATVSSGGAWDACPSGAERCAGIVQSLGNITAALRGSPLALIITVAHVDAAADAASGGFAAAAASLAYRRHVPMRADNPKVAVWFVPAMTIHELPADHESLSSRVLVNSFEIPDALVVTNSDALMHFLGDYCSIDMPVQPNFPGRLIDAIRDLNAAGVQDLVSAGAAVNPTTADGEPCISTNWVQECFRPLHVAIEAARSDADLDVARVLLRGGAAVNRRGADGESLLHRVAKDWANTPTDVASSDNPKNIVAAWLMNKSPIGFGQIDDLGQTVFHVATRYHHHWMLEHMLNHAKFASARGVMGMPDNSGNTVLHYAAGGATWYRGISIASVVPASGSWSDEAQRRAWGYDNPSKYNGYSICGQKLSAQEMGTVRMPRDRGTVKMVSTAMSNCGFFGRMLSLLLTQVNNGNMGDHLINSRNHAGDAPLHLAAMANDPVVVRLLISSGALTEAQNERGLVASEVAAIRGSDEAGASLAKFRRIPDPVPPTREEVWLKHTRHSAPAQPAVASKGDDMSEQLLTLLAAQVSSANQGGWDTGISGRDAEQGGAADLKSKMKCGVMRKNRIASSEFIDDFVLLSRPALISPFGYTQLKAWRAFAKWNRASLLDTYGDLTLQVRGDSVTPFEDSTLLKPMTLREFVASWGQGGAGHGAKTQEDITRPGYVRDATSATYRMLRDLEWQDQMAETAPEEGRKKEEGEWLAGIPFFNASRLRAHSFELNFGPPRSGSSMRFCDHLLDVLVFGERRWFLTPPRYAKVRTGSVLDWFYTEYQNVTYRSDHGVIEVTQRPGEIMYVPVGWGHAVVNTANVVGYGLHFQSFGSGMGERQRWASVTAQREGLLQSKHPTRPVDPMQNFMGAGFNT